MIFFSPAFPLFFEKLAQNNQKDWFEANRTLYENKVRDPFRHFIQTLLNEIQNKDSDIRLEAKDCIFRINRDIRFSKDKTPYKLHASAVIGKEGKKSAEIAGFYLEFSAAGLTFAGGAYQPDKNYLTKIRQEIQSNPQEFQEIIQNPDFVQMYGTMQGEKNKIVPKEFQDDLAEQPLLANKQFYVMVTLPKPELLSQEGLLELTLNHYQTAQPLSRFLRRAFEY